MVIIIHAYANILVMAFWELRLFKEIAITRSMSKGAAHCGVSQSAASQHVQEVERRLGVTLFDRSKRPVELTPAGHRYHEFCRDVLRREEELGLALEPLKGAAQGAVRVASIYSIGLSELSRLQEEFAARYPAAQLHVEYMRPDKIYEAVLDGAADLGLVSYPETGREIAVIAWREEEMQVAAPPSHHLAARAEGYPADLKGLDFIGFDEDLKIRRGVDRFLRVQAEIAQGRVVAVRLHAPELVRPVGIVHRKRKKFNRATELFLELLRS